MECALKLGIFRLANGITGTIFGWVSCHLWQIQRFRSDHGIDSEIRRLKQLGVDENAAELING
jgi:hypothetical protein